MIYLKYYKNVLSQNIKVFILLDVTKATSNFESQNITSLLDCEVPVFFSYIFFPS